MGHAAAIIIVPSCHGDGYIHMRYVWAGKQIEHDAAFDNT